MCPSTPFSTDCISSFRPAWRAASQYKETSMNLVLEIPTNAYDHAASHIHIHTRANV